jgi:hypothetical protein
MSRWEGKVWDIQKSRSSSLGGPANRGTATAKTNEGLGEKKMAARMDWEMGWMAMVIE